MSKTTTHRSIRTMPVSFETIDYCPFDDQLIDNLESAYFHTGYGAYFHSQEEAQLFSEDLGHQPKLTRAERKAIEELGL